MIICILGRISSISDLLPRSVWFQVPVAPLQRPDEMQSSNIWMHTSSSYEDMMTEQGIPTMITWSYDGKEVAVEGSWDNWKTRYQLPNVKSLL